MTFYKWAGKLLVRSEFLSDDEKKRGVTKKFAVSEACCCAQWYCVLTSSGDYECRDKRPDPTENAQVLSEHKTEKECLDQCYERYYCIDESGDYKCVKESDLPENATIISGPQRQEECEAKCENCPPCGNEACESEAKGDDTIIEECCFNLEDEEEWTFNGTDWELTQRCGNDDRTPCKGKPVASFPPGNNAGEVFTLPCVPDGRKPEDNKDCEKCLYDCDKTTTPYTCVYTPDDGKYTEKECDTECVGKWYCKSPSECEQQNPPLNPAKQGYDTEGECVSAAPTECAPPPPPTPKYICAIRDTCADKPLSYGGWFWLADRRWAVGRDQCSSQPPFGTCVVADRPDRPGAYEGERVFVGCKSAVPSDTKECITEEEFNKGGWVKVSGPHDTPADCEAECNPPPDCDCYPPPTLTSLRLEIPADEPTKLFVRWEADWSPPDGCFADDDDARAKATLAVQYLDESDNDLGGDGGPANIGFNAGGQGGPLSVACDPSAPKIAKAKARILSQDGKCISAWSPTIRLDADSPTYEDLCPPPPPPCPPISMLYYWDGSPAVPPEILESNGGWYIRVDINDPNRPNTCAPCETPDTLVKPYVGFQANFTCEQINESLRAKEQRGPNPLP